ncbi:MAG: NAD(P)H-dependent oxidoreductase [Burkholderiales bacterium]
MTSPKILAFAGSLRSGSFNKKLVTIAAAGARAAGAEVTMLDLRDLPLPIYDADSESEHGLPDNARRFKQMLVEHDGVLVASPEYNSTITAVLKNAIDWASRAEPGEPPLVAYRGRIAGVMSASPGALGAIRSLATIRALLAHLGMVVVPAQLGVPRAGEAFDDAGALKDAKQQAAVEKIGADVVHFIQKLNPPR